MTKWCRAKLCCHVGRKCTDPAHLKIRHRNDYWIHFWWNSTSLSRKCWCSLKVVATLRFSLKSNRCRRCECGSVSLRSNHLSLRPPPPQVTRLQEEVQQGEQDIGTAEGQISTLKEAQDKLLEELDATRARLRETSNLLTALQVCTNKHTHTHRLISRCVRLLP